jgi:hypothetical protein
MSCCVDMCIGGSSIDGDGMCRGCKSATKCFSTTATVLWFHVAANLGKPLSSCFMCFACMCSSFMCCVPAGLGKQNLKHCIWACDAAVPVMLLGALCSSYSCR